MNCLKKPNNIGLVSLLIFTLCVFSFVKKNNANHANAHLHDAACSFKANVPFDVSSTVDYDLVFAAYPHFVSESFDFPVGKPDGRNYFKAREFGQNKHLGEDWNGIGGGNTDLGDLVYSISNGYVSFAENVCCGWGNIVRVIHKFPNHPEHEYVESIYAHLGNINVKKGDLITRGQQLGTIGTADGKYSAHLHLELRNFVDMGLGPGYSDDTFGFLTPTKFIEEY